MEQKTYRVEIARPALKSMKWLQAQTGQRIREAIRGLASEPRPNGVKKLEGTPDLYRLRMGRYRVVYSVQDDALLVLVVRVGHRSDAYRNL